jgi:uncharacterized protein
MTSAIPKSGIGIPRLYKGFKVTTMCLMDHIFLISIAGILAGAMNALAGGGSFVTLPALIAAGVPSVQANATSTIALFPGGIVSVWVYRDALGPVGSVPLRRLLLATLLGGMCGAILLMITPTSAFDAVLPWLLLMACVALAGGRRFGEWLRARWRISAIAVLIIQFCLGIYGGYFGGAVGIMMMAIWGLLDKRDLKSLNAPRTALVSAANTMAVLIFSLARAVHWPEAIIMLITATAGGYIGAHIGRRASPKLVRVATLILTAGITVAFFAKAYHLF